MKTTRLLCLCSLSLSALFSTLHASPLSDLVEKHGGSWLIGKWESKDGKAKASYEWRLDKNVIATTLSMPEREVEGTMSLNPSTKEVMLHAVDSKGAVSLGQWTKVDGKAMLLTTVQHEKGELKMATEYVPADADNMTVKIHKQDESGGVGELMIEVPMKRVK